MFSSWPNAFSDRDVSTLQALARRVVENKRGAEREDAVLPSVEEKSQAPSIQLSASSGGGGGGGLGSGMIRLGSRMMAASSRSRSSGGERSLDDPFLAFWWLRWRWCWDLRWDGRKRWCVDWEQSRRSGQALRRLARIVGQIRRTSNANACG